MSRSITSEAFRGVVALLPTTSTEEASQADAPFSVDLREAERATRALVQAGVCAIMTNGSLGEMATLSHDEWLQFNRVVLDTVAAVKPDLPVFVGATSLSTRGTIQLAREVREMGGRGIFIGRPFWCALDATGMMPYYAAVAEAVPELAIVVYDNPEAFKGPIPTEVYRQLARIPQFVASKYTVLTPKFHHDIAAIGDRMRLLPIDVDWLVARTMWPDVTPACWSSTIVCGPEPVMALAEAIAANDVAKARELTKQIGYTCEPFLAMQNFSEFSKYNIPLEKQRFDAAGFIRAGAARHPYHTAPQAYIDGANEMARRWVALCDELRKQQGASKMSLPQFPGVAAANAPVHL